MKKYFHIVLIILAMINMQFYAQTVSKVGTTTASFLLIDAGARAASMGSAFVAVAEDASAIYWNPAGIAKLEGFASTFNHSKWIADLSYNNAAIVLPLGDLGTVGASATFLSTEEMERTTILRPDGTGEMFDAASFAFGITYARNLTEQFSIGLNFKYINERLYHSNANGFAMDVGALFDTQFNGLKIGMNISNYGTKMQLDGRDLLTQIDTDPKVSGNNNTIKSNLATDEYDLPLMFRFGLSMDVLQGLANSNLIISADALHPSDDVESVNLGAEYSFEDLIFLRAGYKSLFAIDSEQGLSLGAGLKYNVLGATTFYFDYAFLEFGLFDSIHMFSVGLGL